MQTLKALACASLASLFPLSAEPMPREDVVEIPAKAGPEKEKGITPPRERQAPARQVEAQIHSTTNWSWTGSEKPAMIPPLYDFRYRHFPRFLGLPSHRR